MLLELMLFVEVALFQDKTKEHNKMFINPALFYIILKKRC